MAVTVIAAKPPCPQQQSQSYPVELPSLFLSINWSNRYLTQRHKAAKHYMTVRAGDGVRGRLMHTAENCIDSPVLPLPKSPPLDFFAALCLCVRFSIS